MRISQSEESKKGVFNVIKRIINDLISPKPIMQLPNPEQFTRVTEKFDVVHRMTLQKITN
jgi:hypothetical protein